MMNQRVVENPLSPTYWVDRLIGSRLFGWSNGAILLAAIWSVYGFCFGQLFGQLARRPVIAVTFAFFLAALVGCLWVPSLLVGGVSEWQVITLPVLMLLTTRLTLRPWLAGRLWERAALARHRQLGRSHGGLRGWFPVVSRSRSPMSASLSM